MLSRFQGSVIEFYKETKWGSYLLPVSVKGTIDWNGPMALEGKVIRTQYTVSPDNNSEFVLHNYKAAFKSAGFEVLIAIANISKDITFSGHIAIYDIHFDGDKATIRPESAEAFTVVANFLKSNSDRQFFIVGHAAGVGNFDLGMKLSKDRAKAVMDELIKKYGVPKDQLKSYGVGALCPVASNNSNEGISKNRRVEIVEQ